MQSSATDTKTSIGQLLVTMEKTTSSLVPLLSLLEPPSGPDRVGQLLEALNLILEAQRHQSDALKAVSDKVDRISRR